MNSTTAKDHKIGEADRTTGHLPYESGQWSPFNKNGKRVYSKEFLMALRKDPKSNKKPNNIPTQLLTNHNKMVYSKEFLMALKKDPKSNKKPDNIPTELITKDNKKFFPNFTAVQPQKEASSKIIVDVNAKDKFNFTPIVDQLVPHNKNKVDKMNSDSNKKPNNSPVTEIENKNSKLSSSANTKSNQKGNDILVASKNEAQKPAAPSIQKLDRVDAATTPQQTQAIDGESIPNKPPNQTVTAPYNNVMPQQTSTNITPLSAPIPRIPPLSNQTTELANRRQGPPLFQMQSTPYSAFSLQPTFQYGNTSTPIQYFNNGLQTPIIYIPPGYQIPPTQSNVHQYSQQGVAANGCGSWLPRGSHKSSTPIPIPTDTSINLPCHLMNILEGYLNDHYNIQEVEQKIKATILPSALPQLTIDGYLHVLEKSKKARLQTGFLFARFIKLGCLSVEDYCGSLEVVLKKTDDLAVDIPRIWDSLAELIFPVLCEGAVEMNNLHKLFTLLIRKHHAAKLLTRLFKLMIKDNKENGSLSFADYTTVVVASRPASTVTPLQAQFNEIFEEYLNDCYNAQECVQRIKTSISPSEVPELVSLGSMAVLGRSKTSRFRTGFLFAQLIKLDVLSIPNYCVGIQDVLEKTNELVTVIPKVWNYLAQLISPVLCENAIALTNLHNSFKLLISNNRAAELLKCLIKWIIRDRGFPFLQSIWNSSNLTFAEFMVESQVDSFVKENCFESLLKASPSLCGNHNSAQNHLSYKEVHVKLIKFFKSHIACGDITSWITQNMGERVQENQFIRTLATACFEDSIVNSKLELDILQDKYSLLHRFVGNKLIFELECLYALQALINKLEHPQGLALAVCVQLYYENVFSRRSFMVWRVSTNPCEQEGRHVVLKQLSCFFTELKEAEENLSVKSQQ